LVCRLQAWAVSETPVTPAEYPYAAEVRFVTLSRSNLSKETARVVLFHFITDVVQRQTKAGLPKLQSCFALCAGWKRLVKELLTNGGCSPCPQGETPKPGALPVLFWSAWSTRTYGKD